MEIDNTAFSIHIGLFPHGKTHVIKYFDQAHKAKEFFGVESIDDVFYFKEVTD